ncbi:MAG: hypothetical protein K2X44_09465 [Magnetospirillum sp.]|nr:hypothetical protein [Magnetospirillum sp.]
MLPTVLYHLLTGSCRDVAWTAEGVLEIWRSTGADDARIGNLLRMILPHTVAQDDVTWVEIDGMPTAAKLFPDVVIWTGGGVFTMPELVAAARQLLAADDPPSMPIVAPLTAPISKPVQMSLF